MCYYVCVGCVYIYIYIWKKLLTQNDIDENKNVKLHGDESHARILRPLQHNIQKAMALVKLPYVSKVVEI